MKREGRQHGMVRAHSIVSAPWDPRPNRGYPNGLTSPPTAGLFTKVSTKPTNHSKFTGKCGRPMCRGCHEHPACKSKDKVKGAHKIRSVSNAGPDYSLVTWRVVGSRAGLKLSGLSATGVSDYLASDEGVGGDYEGDYDQDNEELGSYNHGIDDDDNNNEDEMSYCEPLDGNESWCLVERMVDSIMARLLVSIQ